MCQPARKKTCKPRRATPRPQPGEKVVPVRCQPATYPCPSCGRRGHRRHKYDRFVRSLAYGQFLCGGVSAECPPRAFLYRAGGGLEVSGFIPAGGAVSAGLPR